MDSELQAARDEARGALECAKSHLAKDGSRRNELAVDAAQDHLARSVACSAWHFAAAARLAGFIS